jgi:hypothetical protein
MNLLLPSMICLILLVLNLIIFWVLKILNDKCGFDFDGSVIGAVKITIGYLLLKTMDGWDLTKVFLK